MQLFESVRLREPHVHANDVYLGVSSGYLQDTVKQAASLCACNGYVAVFEVKDGKFR